MTGLREVIAALFGRRRDGAAPRQHGRATAGAGSDEAGSNADGPSEPREDAGADPPEPYDKPLPDIHEQPHAEPFWAATTEERLLVQHCRDCGEFQYFPRPWCHHCASDDIEWTEAEGVGTVYSYTIVRTTVSNPEFAGDVPYVTAYVELAEGPRMLTMLTGCSPDAVERGMPVEVRFEHVTDDVALPLFEPQ